MLTSLRSASSLLGLAFLLAACSQSPTPTSRAWTYTAPQGRINAQSLTPGVNTLQYERLLYANNGWGPAEKNTSNGEIPAGDGHPLTLNGKRYAQGYGVHSNSELQFSLKGTDGASCSRFTTDIGVDDEVNNRGSVDFQIFLDGVKAYDSGTMTGGSATRTVDLDITGRVDLRLVVTDAGDGGTSDHADWADPRILCEASASPLHLQTAQNSYSTTHTQSITTSVTFSASRPEERGPIDLRLESLDLSNPSLLRLDTTRLDYPGSGSITRDLVIAAPTIKTDAAVYTCHCRLIASANGQDVASSLLDVVVYPAGWGFNFVSPNVQASVGQTVTLTLEVTSAVVPMKFTVAPYLVGSWADSEAYGELVGPREFELTTKTAYVPIQFKFKRTPPNEYHAKSFSFYFTPEGFTNPPYTNIPYVEGFAWTATP